MIETVFLLFNSLLYKSTLIAVGGSFLWGVLSVVASPCHLGSIPLIIAFVNGRPEVDTRRAFFISLLFSSGILVSISTIGLITGLAGRIMGDIGNTGVIILIIVFIIIGLNFLGLIHIPDIIKIDYSRIIKTEGYFSALLLGILFGLALGPCTFAFMAPILAITFNSASNDFLYSIIIVSAYAVGHSLVFIIFGTFSSLVKKLLKWENSSGSTEKIKKIIGIIMIFTAVYIAFKNIRV